MCIIAKNKTAFLCKSGEYLRHFSFFITVPSFVICNKILLYVRIALLIFQHEKCLSMSSQTGSLIYHIIHIGYFCGMFLFCFGLSLHFGTVYILNSFVLYFSTLSVLSSSCSCTCSVQFPLEAESHLRTTTSRSPSRKEATWGTSIKTGPRNFDPLGPTCKMRQARPKKKRMGEV